MSGFTLVDYKTSVSIQKAWQLQVSGGYRLLAEYGDDPAKRFKIDQCLALRLDANGGPAKAKEYGDLMDTAFFLHILDGYRFFHGPEIHRVTDIISPYVNKEWFTELDRERGQEVHRVCAAIARGFWAPPLKLHQGYIDSFQAWFDDCIEEVVLVEERLVSTELGFTGQLDLIAKLKQGWKQ